MDPLIGGALIMGGTSLLGGLGSLFGAKSSANTQYKNQLKLMAQQHEYNKQSMAYSMGLQSAQQQNLMKSMYNNQVSGMANAGLNPATANGTSPIIPASPSPQTGPSGPTAGMPQMDIARSIMEGARLGAEIDNIKADTKVKESQSQNLDEDTKLKQWQNDPQYQQLLRNGLSATAAKDWAAANLSDKESIKCMSEVQKIGKEMGLMDEQINEIQTLTAKYRQDIAESIQGMKESDARILLMQAQRQTESAKQTELYASAGEHTASAAEHRAGVVEKHASARQKGQAAKLDAIKTKMAEFEQKVIEASGDANEQGALRGAKRLVNVINPLSAIID